MNENQDASTNKRNIWLRGLYMLLMAFAFQVSGTVLCIVTVVQFVTMLLTGAPNARLVSFGRNLGRYFQTLVHFLTFAAEEIPFPFSDWPASD